jgi:uncharacterized protein (TIGR00251 family)
MTTPLFTTGADHLTLTIRAKPNASRSAILGEVDIGDERRALAVALAAPPVDGAANKALIALFAKAFAVRKSAVTIASGEAAKIKIVRIAGDGPALAAIAARFG